MKISRKAALSRLHHYVEERQSIKENIVAMDKTLKDLNYTILKLMDVLKIRETKFDGLGKVQVIRNTYTKWDVEAVEQYYKKHKLPPPIKQVPTLDEVQLLKDIEDGRVSQKILDKFAIITQGEPYVKVTDA